MEAFQQQARRRSDLTAWRRAGEVTALGAGRPLQQVLWEVKRLPMKILKTQTRRITKLQKRRFVCFVPINIPETEDKKPPLRPAALVSEWQLGSEGREEHPWIIPAEGLRASAVFG